MTFILQTLFLIRRTVREGYVPVTDVLEEMDLIFIEKQTRGNRMNWGIAPSLIEESSILVESFEEVFVSFAAQPIQISNLEI